MHCSVPNRQLLLLSTMLCSTHALQQRNSKRSWCQTPGNTLLHKTHQNHYADMQASAIVHIRHWKFNQAIYSRNGLVTATCIPKLIF